MRKRLGNIVLREILGENCAERDIGGKMCSERYWGNTVLRERLGEYCAERDIGGTLC